MPARESDCRLRIVTGSHQPPAL